jgi:hypothetical protein
LRVVVSDPAFDEGRGQIYLYEKHEEGWIYLALEHPALAAGDQFGWSLDLQPNRLLVGAPGDDTQGADSGTVYLYWWCAPPMHGAGCPFSCDDDSQNGLESDQDCGGSVCPQCLVGDSCVEPSDCLPPLTCAVDVCAE